MNALEARLLALLGGGMAEPDAVRVELGCSAQELSSAVWALRARDLVEFDSLALTPEGRDAAAMLSQTPPAQPEGAADPEGPAEATPAQDVASAGAAAATPAAPAELLAEIADYCRRTGTPEGFIGKVAFNHPGFVPLLRKRGSLRDAAAAKVREVLAAFPDGIAKHQAVAPIHRQAAEPVERIAAIEPAPFEEKGGGLVRVTGEQLVAELLAAAAAKGVTVEAFVHPIWPWNTKWKIEQVRIAKAPRCTTVELVRALIAGGPLPEQKPEPTNQGVPRVHREALGLEPSVRELKETAQLSAIQQRRANDRAKAELAEQAATTRAPGETLADAVRREALAAGQRRSVARVAGGGTGNHDECGRRVEAGGDDVDCGAIRAERTAREERELASPSALIRRATKEWPDKCAKVAAVAAGLGIQLGEAWQRVIDAGIMTLSEDVFEESKP